MMVATKKDDLKSAQIALRPFQALDVATMVFTAKGVYNGATSSVWSIKVSPWSGYELNTDVKTTDGNYQGLKDQSRQTTLTEESNKVPNTKGSSSSETKAAIPTPKGAVSNFFSKIFGSSGNAATGEKPTNSIFKDAYDGASKAVSGAASSVAQSLGFGGGSEVNHPGKGTGGDINSIPQPKGNGTWAALKDTILGAAKMVGVDGKLAGTIAAIESGFNYTVKAGSSSATGLFQFIKSTWDTMLRKYGPKYGISPDAQPSDPRANALMGAEFLRENAEAIAGSVKGRKITDTDLYFAHFLGAGGAKKFLSADPSEIAANLMPAAANANPSIFYRDGRALNVGEVYALVNARVRSKGKQFGLEDGSEKTVASSTPTTGDVKTASIPVSDRDAPNKAPAGKAGTPSAAKSPVPNTIGAAVGAMTDSEASTPPSDAPDMTSFVSSRSRDQAAMTQNNRDQAAAALVTTNDILAKSLGVQNKLLDAMNDVLAVIKARPQVADSTKLDTPATPATVVPAYKQAPRQMTPAPVSMAKDS
jgi:hypothetical protein